MSELSRSGASQENLRPDDASQVSARKVGVSQSVWRVVVVQHKMDGDARKVVKADNESDARRIAARQLAAGHGDPTIERREVGSSIWRAA